MKKTINYICERFSTVFGAGYLPKAPGTWGTAAALPLVLIIPNEGVLLWMIFLVLFFAGVYVSGQTAGARNQEDPACIVIDEFVCFIPVFFLIPKEIPYIIAGFVVYRIMDIFKPFPAKQAENLPGGWGIMADDFVAAIYTNLILHAIVYFRFFG